VVLSLILSAVGSHASSPSRPPGVVGVDIGGAVEAVELVEALEASLLAPGVVEPEDAGPGMNKGSEPPALELEDGSPGEG
jgi:hypothetical protein